jgi:putative iron-dependent peroxidase
VRSEQTSDATPQSGIFALGTRYQHHLELDVHPGASTGQITAALAGLREPTVAGGAANLVVGFGADLWTRIRPGDVPVDLGPFTPVDGLDGMHAPATQHDIWVWIHGGDVDVVFDIATAVTAALAPVAHLVEDRPCFVYRDSRDLTGFIDGTANPTPFEATGTACLPAGCPGAGGSHVLTMRWVHDLETFHGLSVSAQEDVFGRRKLDSEELPDELMPPDAHIALAEIHDADGEEREIYRRSVPWGAVGEHGLYFLGFSAERDRFDQMLAAIYGTDGRTIRDRLLDFSTPVSGSYYFAPCVEELLALGIDGDGD